MTSIEFWGYLYKAYREEQVKERVEYVLIYRVGQRVLDKLNISRELFISCLLHYYPMWLKEGRLVALEVDALPSEKWWARGWPVVFDGANRYVIAMKEK